MQAAWPGSKNDPQKVDFDHVTENFSILVRRPGFTPKMKKSTRFCQKLRLGREAAFSRLTLYDHQSMLRAF